MADVALIPFAFYDPLASALRALARANISTLLERSALRSPDRAALLGSLRALLQ
jgi:hypothetical protein